MAFAAHGHNYSHGGQYGHSRHGHGGGDDDSVKHARMSRSILDDVKNIFQVKTKTGNDIKMSEAQQR